jgi:hypothetical protein
VRKRITAMTLIALVLAGCGGLSAAEKHKIAERKQAAKAKREYQKKVAEAQAEHDRCAAALEPLMSALQRVEGRVDVGLNEHDYSEVVGEAAAADSQAAEAIAKHDFACYGVGTKAENALGEYGHAVKEWRECIESYSCETSSIDPTLQERWTHAAADLRRARSSLAALATVTGNAKQKVQALEEMIRKNGK